ncbi:MAG TPA: hypothetical protein VGI71_00375 [Scandinavium sp.]|jgi:OOP family OmpA-OmpF porin
MFLQRSFSVISLSVALLSSTSALAKISTEEANKHLFGASWQDVSAPAPDRSKIVYYREGPQQSDHSGANIYIDGRFHTALQAGGYTVFCLVPGNHTLGAYQHEAPLYQGKTDELYRVKLEAGKTYFIKVANDGSSAPVPVLRETAENALKGALLQKHALSRAMIVDCIRPSAK